MATQTRKIGRDVKNESISVEDATRRSTTAVVETIKIPKK